MRFGSWRHRFWVHCLHAVRRAHGDTDAGRLRARARVCVLHTVEGDKQSDTRRLPSSASHTRVRPARRHKAVFAEALV